MRQTQTQHGPEMKVVGHICRPNLLEQGRATRGPWAACGPFPDLPALLGRRRTTPHHTRFTPTLYTATRSSRFYIADIAGDGRIG